jgi:hypothetical protein
MLKSVKGFCAAARWVVIALAWIPTQAYAQLCIPLLTCPSPDNTPPTVSVTSPASGATVSGTITVTASASDNRGVAGVQFQLDGVNGGAEDTTAPYSVSWDTATASNGSHTLTAVARDAAGNRTTSNPVTVTVANDTAPPPPATVRRYEETNVSVSYSPGWVQRNPNNDWLAWSGGTAVHAVTPGARATFTFTGTSVAWIGYRSTQSGIARVYMDGVFVSDVDLFARKEEVRVPVFTATGLTNGSHTLTIEVTGLANALAKFNFVVVDAFDVPAPPVSRLQDMDSDITYTAGWALGDGTSRSGGTATVSSAPGAQATFTFSGTAISWIGYRGPDTGIARVFLDGSFAGEVDTYSPAARIQDIVFVATGLTDARHTLTIDVTGTKNAASTDTLIEVDAFDVTTVGTRSQETDSAVTYSGAWGPNNRNRPWNEGTATVAGTAGAQARFTFTGTSVSWIGFRAERTGIARVYLDDIFVTEVDTYAPTEGPQNTLFKATGLANGEHTLTIEVTGRKNPASTNVYVVVDAFDVTP